MRNGAIFWGSLIILIGAALLLGNLFTVNIWPYLWPLGLVFIGVWIIGASLMRPKPAEAETVTIPLQGAATANLKIRHGAGRLVIRGGAGPDVLATGSFTGGLEHREDRRGDALDVMMSVPSGSWMNFSGPWILRPWNPILWDVRLNETVPMTLDLETGAGESQMDFSSLKAQDISLKTGASSSEMILPARAGKTRVKVESGAAAVVLRVPDGVAARIAVESGLAGISIDTNRFPRSGSGYQSPDYDRAENSADIRIQTGVGSVSVR
jgi:hypothetical protein